MLDVDKSYIPVVLPLKIQMSIKRHISNLNKGFIGTYHTELLLDKYIKRLGKLTIRLELRS